MAVYFSPPPHSPALTGPSPVPLSLSKNHRWSHRVFTVACHPEEPYFVTGDSQGKIIVWRGLLSAAAPEAVTTVLHWHAHAVNTLCFNSDGTYLLSGGQEAVLTMWQMLTGAKRFLPRLGAPLSRPFSAKVGASLTLSRGYLCQRLSYSIV